MSFTPGENIGPYRIVEQLGSGGMATVYKAYHAALDRYVAIKVLSPEMNYDQRRVERWRRLAREFALPNHPNIVTVHDVGQQDGITYVVMEHLEGQTLQQVLQQKGSLSPETAGSIVGQIAGALDFVHRRGMIHQNVTPANVWLDQYGRVILTDPGLAGTAHEESSITHAGMLVGSPEYMSPEQAEGRQVDHRTDLYSLGVVLYRMLTGSLPFQGSTPLATLHAVYYETPVPPRQINRALSPAVEAVVLKAMAKNPDQRFQHGAEMAEALRAALAETTWVSATESRPAQQASRPGSAQEPMETPPPIHSTGPGSELEVPDSQLHPPPPPPPQEEEHTPTPMRTLVLMAVILLLITFLALGTCMITRPW